MVTGLAPGALMDVRAGTPRHRCLVRGQGNRI